MHNPGCAEEGCSCGVHMARGQQKINAAVVHDCKRSACAGTYVCRACGNPLYR